LVRLLFEDFLINEQWKRRRFYAVPIFVRNTTHLASHIVTVWQAKEVIEAVVGREKVRLIAAMPFSDRLSCITVR
jgi:hypothetical protein